VVIEGFQVYGHLSNILIFLLLTLKEAKGEKQTKKLTLRKTTIDCSQWKQSYWFQRFKVE